MGPILHRLVNIVQVTSLGINSEELENIHGCTVKSESSVCIIKHCSSFTHSFRQTGPSCSKLTTSLVNDSLKFTSSDTQISYSHFFCKKYQNIVY